MEGFRYHAAGDTIAAISTAQAPAAIGVVRVSGPRAIPVAARVFASAFGKKLEDARGYTALFGHVHDPDGGLIDEAVALVFRAPKSFTGEDVVELSCHGGLYVTRRLLRAVLGAGAAPAGPGEFTRRAFLNGKMGLTEAESVMQIVSARGERAARAALSGRGGALERGIRSVREALTAAAAHLDAWADYPEDDVPAVDPKELEKTLAAAQARLSALLARYDSGRALREGVDTAIAGKPNTGKSTLMNRLSGCDRSIVTPYAGTTRDVVEETVLLGGVPLRLADTAGLRASGDPVEQAGVGRALARVRSARLVLAVFDSSRPLDPDDRALVRELSSAPAGSAPGGAACIAVVNKCDLPREINFEYIKTNFQHTVEISAARGEGLDRLERAVLDVLGAEADDPSQAALFTERQREDARRAAESLGEALSALRSGVTLDAVTVSVEDAVSALLELTGERATERVVDEVFRRFCVGK